MIVILLTAIFLSSLGNCTVDKLVNEGFAIYLIDEPGSLDEIPKIKDVVIGNTPFLSLDDIICYNSATYELVLTGSAFTRYQNIEGAFAVCVDRQPVYTGVFWNWFSSMSLDRIVILERLSAENDHILVIQTGYPGEGFYQGDDPRNDERIMNSLREARKLIEVPSSGEKISTPFKGWDLYSFERDGKWYYTLIFGTNRTKWLDEIVFEDGDPDEEGIYHRIGTGEIISLLSRLEIDTSIFWRPGVGIDPPPESDVTFSLPSQDILNVISHYTSEFGLDLYVYREFH